MIKWSPSWADDWKLFAHCFITRKHLLYIYFSLFKWHFAWSATATPRKAVPQNGRSLYRKLIWTIHFLLTPWLLDIGSLTIPTMVLKLETSRQVLNTRHQLCKWLSESVGPSVYWYSVFSGPRSQCTVKHHTDIINFACMAWNFVRISASLSALCTNFNQICYWHCISCKILPHFDVRTISVAQKL